MSKEFNHASIDIKWNVLLTIRHVEGTEISFLVLNICFSKNKYYGKGSPNILLIAAIKFLNSFVGLQIDIYLFKYNSFCVWSSSEGISLPASTKVSFFVV